MDSTEGNERLRTLMRQVPSPVTVVTAAREGEMRGITIGSFTSTSLDPPLISFNLARDAQMYPLMSEVDWFVVHVLAEDQARLGNQFSIRDTAADEQFVGIDYELDERGTPVLDGVVSVLRCRKHATYDAGDHVIIVGEVVESINHADKRPIVYYDRSYHTVGSIADATLFDPVQESAGGGA